MQLTSLMAAQNAVVPTLRLEKKPMLFLSICCIDSLLSSNCSERAAIWNRFQRAREVPMFVLFGFTIVVVLAGWNNLFFLSEGSSIGVRKRLFSHGCKCREEISSPPSPPPSSSRQQQQQQRFCATKKEEDPPRFSSCRLASVRPSSKLDVLNFLRQKKSDA